MLANFFTKPLQGSLFQRLREVIMGWKHVNILQDYVPHPKKERNENHVSGDKSETLQKANYVQFVTGDRIVKTDGMEWSKFGSKERKDFWRIIKVVQKP